MLPAFVFTHCEIGNYGLGWCKNMTHFATIVPNSIILAVDVLISGVLCVLVNSKMLAFSYVRHKINEKFA